MSLGQTIKSLRKRRRLSQTELAQESAISVTFLSLVENDRKHPSIETLRSISEALQVPYPVLVFLSLDETDIPEDKRAAFGLISGPVQDYIARVFFDEG
ncbi:MAG TPA: helix-turn-helix transcriptional regulator [Candidatus Kapabacteria bacterium]|nr:helix-turn-helix transcriptional regulator [Candidatus Kapabacteria bacterium]